jgi:hyperosmotically inducible periplasmic protein
MKKIILLLVVSCLTFAVGCSKEPEGQTSTTMQDADNTARNEDQKAPDALAATDQGQSEADIRITASIRESMTRDKSLSTNARNVKIITSAGNVTLRGPVKSEAEKNKIEAYAKIADGVDRVDNMLEIEKNP